MMNGGNLWDLQKILGHSDIKTTEEFYAHFSVEHIQKRANVISLGETVIQVDFRRGVVARLVVRKEVSQAPASLTTCFLKRRNWACN